MNVGPCLKNTRYFFSLFDLNPKLSFRKERQVPHMLVYLYNYYVCLQINFKTFLTMNDDDLKSIGILKNSLRSKILKVISHNKRVFC